MTVPTMTLVALRREVYQDACAPGVDPCPVCQAIERGIERALLCDRATPAADEAPVYWGVPEVAKLLRVSEKSVYRVMKQDATFPVIRIGQRVVRFRRADVLRWIDERTTGEK